MKKGVSKFAKPTGIERFVFITSYVGNPPEEDPELDDEEEEEEEEPP